MLIDILPGDEFADLPLQAHDEALALYAEAVSGEARRLSALEPGTSAHEQCLDKLARLLKLRQVHLVRREELVADEPFTSTSQVARQYYENERNSHLMS